MMTNVSLAKNNTGRITVSDAELYYECTGKGDPLILIHAGFSDRRDWKHQFEHFGKKFYTIAYDQRGAGNSSIPTTPFWSAEDLRALMDHLKIEKAILVGHSIGGTVSLDFALQYPKRVAALILIASGLNGYSWSEKYTEWFKEIWSVPQSEEMTKKALSGPLFATSMVKPEIKSEVAMITKESLEKILVVLNG